MKNYDNRSAYLKSPWQLSVRSVPVPAPKGNQLLLEISACAVCGTDFHYADRMYPDWTAFGHEIAGVVKEVGEGVTRFKVGDRVALDSSVPCGRCAFCLPPPYGHAQPNLCLEPLTFWNSTVMGFGKLILTPQECAVPVPDGVPMEVACLTEPVGVATDLVKTAEIKEGDRVLVIGPGPLGLAAIVMAERLGAEHIFLAGLSNSVARLEAGKALGADTIIRVDKEPLEKYDFGKYKPNKIMVTAPPKTLPEAIKVGEVGAVIAYLGIAFGPDSVIQFDADDFHFRKLSLRGSFASPAIYAADSIRLLASVPELSRQLISHRFKLEEIDKIMTLARDDREMTVKKLVMVND